jgi:S-formylglutathione hydrolase
MEILSKHKVFGGYQGFYSHESEATGTTMKFSVFEPDAICDGPVPVLTYLAGLTCTEETFVTKGGAQRVAAELGLMLVAPDTSPRGTDKRGENVPDDADGGWDFGLGAGFYLNATEAPFADHYKMDDYVVKDLQAIVFSNFNGDRGRQGIFGHSMGGHGALTLGLKSPDLFKSLSAFAPICAPMSCPWGKKAFSGYLGDDKDAWANHDASMLIAGIKGAGDKPTILVDQGLGDNFLEAELHPHLLEEGAKASGYPLTLRRHEGYDHGYYFIQSFMEDHLRHHANILK